MSRRYFDSAVKSVLHFDYPHYKQTGDGLRDDAGLFTWERSGNVLLGGNTPPADLIDAALPKFGYRCLRATGYIYSHSSAWSLNSSSDYEASMWLKPAASQDGLIFSLYNGSTQMLALKATSSLKLLAVSGELALNLESSQTLTLGTWYYIQLQLTGSTVRILIDGANAGQASITRKALTVDEARLGGVCWNIDEFVYRQALSSGVPTQPLQGVIPADALGGFGTGRLGDVRVMQSVHVNTAATASINLKTTDNTYIFPFVSKTEGAFGDLLPGEEVIIIDPVSGSYQFSTIKELNSVGVTLFDRVTVPIVAGITTIAQIPHFKTLTIPANHTLSESKGIIAFRCQGDCTLLGSIKVLSRWRERTDDNVICHSDLPDKFIYGAGGGIFIACGGTFSTGSNGLIGSTVHELSGYGGKAGGTSSTSNISPQVGWGTPVSGTSIRPGFSAPDNGTTLGGRAGSSMILIAKTLAVDPAALRLGGVDGLTTSTPTGGGGSGFCYIACERTA